MSDFQISQFSSDDELAAAVAAKWLAETPVGAPGAVALSGGRVARKLFSSVANSADAANSLNAVHFFWADERCVSPTDPESNFAVAKELLLDPLGIRADRIHRIKGEISPEEAGRAAEQEFLGVMRSRPGKEQSLDLVLLGMGEDGHVASLFPGEPREMVKDPAVYRAVTATKPPPRRVTLGYQAIFSARSVWVLASGPGKEAALRESIASNGDTPLARVLKHRRHTDIFTDIPLTSETQPSGLRK